MNANEHIARLLRQIRILTRELREHPETRLDAKSRKLERLRRELATAAQRAARSYAA